MSNFLMILSYRVIIIFIIYFYNIAHISNVFYGSSQINSSLQPIIQRPIKHKHRICNLVVLQPFTPHPYTSILYS